MSLTNSFLYKATWGHSQNIYTELTPFFKGNFCPLFQTLDSKLLGWKKILAARLQFSEMCFRSMTWGRRGPPVPTVTHQRQGAAASPPRAHRSPGLPEPQSPFSTTERPVGAEGQERAHTPGGQPGLLGVTFPSHPPPPVSLQKWPFIMNTLDIYWAPTRF